MAPVDRGGMLSLELEREDAALHTALRREDAGSIRTCRWGLHWGLGLEGQDVLGAEEVTL